ncbi:Protein NLRC5 [Holothuria leucospilota]|uniref:Protein NLRC5 n=1 Tax=Holothuria leucospilota TaxID=206669 RepID=A0A9Q1HKY7_HOLLE|nr:Protein NLRC5 [Holothuria leucospilota]
MDTDIETGSFLLGSGQCGTAFGRFLVDLAGLLTVHIVVNLSNYFEFSMAQKDKLNRAEYPGQLMIDYLQERGVITPTDISPLLKALAFLKMDGVQRQVLSFFHTHGLEKDETQGRLVVLQKFLKAVYERLYSAVHPIPYIRDGLYSVNEVFVECGIEVIKSTTNGRSQWSSGESQSREHTGLNSYQDLFNPDVICSNRIIIEGDPGYGKSTLTLQAAYDWCQKNHSSPLANIEVFILLPLRLLKGITSIYKAIKLFILPRDCNLTENDIKEILIHCNSLLIILDGFDEYPHGNSDLESDFTEIIKGNMFINHRVVLCTRSGCIPKSMDPRTIRVRLMGFNEYARDNYLRLALGESPERIRQIKQNLDQNPIMRDLCQVPFFFVIFAHVAHESNDIYKCDSVTSFFKYIMQCFYCHMLRKGEESGTASSYISERNIALHKLVFDGLAGDAQIILWDKRNFCQKVGSNCLDELLRIGIIVEEKFLVIDATVSEVVQEKTFVRFCHKLFAEWYAAHYLFKIANKAFAVGLKSVLKKCDSVDLQFIFRFACGLKPTVTKRIVKYLKELPGGNTLATLCILEKTGSANDILDIVREMCLKQIDFEGYESNLLQRSKIQLLSIASKNQIKIAKLCLVDCFQFADVMDGPLCLLNGLHLPKLDTLMNLVVCDNGDFRNWEGDIYTYMAKAAHWNILTILGSLQPKSYNNKELLAMLRSENRLIEWDNFLGDWLLNVETGKWDDENGREMTNTEYSALAMQYDCSD